MATVQALLDGPALGHLGRRANALAAEIEWLIEHRLPRRSPFSVT